MPVLSTHKRPAACLDSHVRRPAASLSRRPAAAAPSILDIDLARALVKMVLGRMGKSDTLRLEQQVRKMQVVPMAGACTGSNVAGFYTHVLLQELGCGKLFETFTCESDLNAMVANLCKFDLLQGVSLPASSLHNNLTLST